MRRAPQASIPDRMAGIASCAPTLSVETLTMRADPLHSPARGRRPPPVAGCVLLLLAFASAAGAQDSAAPPPADTTAAMPLTPEQLQSLVAPIALYPDELLAQTLVASTYPLEVIQLSQWMAKHPDLKDKALADSVAQQPWDPSIQSMAAVPEVVKRLADDIQWTTDLGNAFLAQQADVMDAVQVMRKHAKDKGALESNEQQKVDTVTVEKTTVIVIESTNPEVVYVPSYNPVYVYPPPVYPYPPIYYPPYYPGTAFVSFSIGLMWGAAIWGGPCCHARWGGNTIIINNSNNFNRTSNINRGQAGRDWQHNPSHRGGAPYGDRATADRFGGRTSGPSAGTMDRSGRTGGAGLSNRASGAAGVSNRAAAGRPSTSQSIGNRSVPSGSRSSGFSGGSRGYSGGSARASSTRGASSFGGSRGGGRRR